MSHTNGSAVEMFGGELVKQNTLMRFSSDRPYQPSADWRGKIMNSWFFFFLSSQSVALSPPSCQSSFVSFFFSWSFLLLAFNHIQTFAGFCFRASCFSSHNSQQMQRSLAPCSRRCVSDSCDELLSTENCCQDSPLFQNVNVALVVVRSIFVTKLICQIKLINKGKNSEFSRYRSDIKHLAVFFQKCLLNTNMLLKFFGS